MDGEQDNPPMLVPQILINDSPNPVNEMFPPNRYPVINNPFLISSIPPLSGNNHGEFFETLEVMGPYQNGQRTK
ncbi:hypothetical protein JTE90_003456 [Oedothorax gibbosus]|uniref:Uncharacterized protein n=1 Tax=Oedothorax gibbosus TaxID=931172 RepID=A0AAV6TYB0_9ARAC|nr:hypothetical protein JTE90_003456 [Oedothorax gibbosus]